MNIENMNNNKILPSFKDEFCVWSEGIKETPEYEVSEEYILPDYLPILHDLVPSYQTLLP